MADERNTNAITQPVLSTLLGLDGEGWDRGLIIAVIIAALAAIAVGLATAGSIITHKREAEQAKADLESYKLEVAGKVADARREGISAGQTAGDAVLRAAALEKEAAEAKERTAIAEKIIAEINLRIANLSVARSMNIEQINELEDFCKENKGYKFDVSLASLSGESFAIARQVASVLRNGGWDQVNSTSGLGMTQDGYTFGYAVSDSEIEVIYAPESADLKQVSYGLASKLASFNFKTVFFQPGIEGFPRDIIHIVVGQKRL